MNKKRVSKGFTRTANALVWGYTLVEILVGLTIIGMVFGVGFASFRSFARRQSVSSAIRALKADLRLAQEQALAGKKPDSPNCNSPNLLDGYTFNVDSSSQYTIEARCTGGSVTVKQVNLENIALSIPFPNPILFKVLGQGTNIAGASQANIVVEEVQTGFALAIAVLPSGDVSEIEVPSPSPVPTATLTPTVTSSPTPTSSVPTPTNTRTPTPTSTLTLTPTPTPTSSGLPWYAAGWGYRKLITISSSKVAGGASLASFPILISRTDADLRVTGSGGHMGQSDGGDILFTLVDAVTKIDHEIESYTASTGALVAWVEIPALSAASNTQIYIYYGNASAADQWNPAGTWEGSFVAVWHLGSDFLDSTSGNHDATNVGSTGVAGIAGSGRDFNGSSNYINTNYSPSFSSNQDFTISVWTSPDTATGRDLIFGSEDADGSPHTEVNWRDDTNIVGFHLRDDANSGSAPDCSNTTVNNGTFHQITYVHDDNASPSLVTYFDGAALCNNAANNANGAHTHGCPLFLGASNLCGTGAQGFLNGQIDEVRISNSLRSAGWIQTSYNSISSPSTFYSVGAEEPKP